MMIRLCLLLVSISALAYGQVPGFGGCPNITAMTTLDNGKFAGRWYTAERYYAFFDDGKCVSHMLLDLSLAQLLLSINADKTTSIESWNLGASMMLGPSFPGQMLAIYYSPITQTPFPVPYKILDTDYTSYAIGYNCIDLGLLNTKVAWIFTRDKFPTNATMAKAYASFDSFKLDRWPLGKVDHSTCTWWH